MRKSIIALVLAVCMLVPAMGTTAGAVAFTGLFDAEYPCCGMVIGSAVYYGRVAAQTALAG